MQRLVMAFICFLYACSTSSSANSRQLKSLKELTLSKTGLDGELYALHSEGLNIDSPFTKSLLLARLLPRILGIRQETVRKGTMSTTVFAFEQAEVMGLRDLLGDWKVRIGGHKFLESAGTEFVEWAERQTYLSSPEIVLYIMQEAFSNETRVNRFKLIQSGEAQNISIPFVQTCQWNNFMMFNAVKNMFTRNNLEVLSFSYLSPVMFSLTNPEMEVTRRDWNPVCMWQIRNSCALSIYPESSSLFSKEIQKIVSSFVLTPLPVLAKSNEQCNILNLLSIISLSHDDLLAKALVQKIDYTRVDGELRTWIVQHFGGHRRNFSFLKKHLIEAGWVLPEDVEIPKVRFLCHSFVKNHFGSQYTSHCFSYEPKYEVDVYTIDPFETYEDSQQLASVCRKNKEMVTVRGEDTKLTIVFPSGLRVTPVMINILSNWAMERNITEEEDRLARLIILTDQVSIIKHN